MDEKLRELVSAWKRWDQWCQETSKRNYRTPANWRSSPDDPANRMEDACQAVAREIGMPCSRFREQLMALRREGVNREEAIRRVVA